MSCSVLIRHSGLTGKGAAFQAYYQGCIIIEMARLCSLPFPTRKLACDKVKVVAGVRQLKGEGQGCFLWQGSLLKFNVSLNSFKLWLLNEGEKWYPWNMKRLSCNEIPQILIPQHWQIIKSTSHNWVTLHHCSHPTIRTIPLSSEPVNTNIIIQPAATTQLIFITATSNHYFTRSNATPLLRHKY